MYMLHTIHAFSQAAFGKEDGLTLEMPLGKFLSSLLPSLMLPFSQGPLKKWHLRAILDNITTPPRGVPKLHSSLFASGCSLLYTNFMSVFKALKLQVIFLLSFSQRT